MVQNDSIPVHFRYFRWVGDAKSPSRELSKLRAPAHALLAEGNTVYRERFALQSISLTARAVGMEATADFAIEVGSRTSYDAAWDLIMKRIDDAL